MCRNLCFTIGKHKKHNSRLLHLWPLPDNPRRYTLSWASVYIEEKIIQQMKGSRWGSYLDQLIRVDELSRGYVPI